MNRDVNAKLAHLFALALRCAHSFARSLTPELVGKKVIFLGHQVFLNHSSLVTVDARALALRQTERKKRIRK